MTQRTKRIIAAIVIIALLGGIAVYAQKRAARNKELLEHRAQVNAATTTVRDTVYQITITTQSKNERLSAEGVIVEKAGQYFLKINKFPSVVSNLSAVTNAWVSLNKENKNKQSTTTQETTGYFNAEKIIAVLEEEKAIAAVKTTSEKMNGTDTVRTTYKLERDNVIRALKRLEQEGTSIPGVTDFKDEEAALAQFDAIAKNTTLIVWRNNDKALVKVLIDSKGNVIKTGLLYFKDKIVDVSIDIALKQLTSDAQAPIKPIGLAEAILKVVASQKLR